MGDVSKDVMGLLSQLLPGFLAAWVIYALTNHAKPSQFERVVQALILSYLIQVLVTIEEAFLLWAGRWIRIGTWTDDSTLVASSITAIGVGLLASYMTQKDTLHRFARRTGLTRRTAHPTEWVTAFQTTPPRHIVVHLSGGRRLAGYPLQWPSDPPNGHIELSQAAWLNDDGSSIELENSESILVPAKDIEMVEFLHPDQSNALQQTPVRP